MTKKRGFGLFFFGPTKKEEYIASQIRKLSEILIKMRLLPIILCLILVSSCSQTYYYLKTDFELSEIIWKTNTKNYIPILKSELDKSVVLATTHRFLKQQELFKLKQYLNSNSSDNSDVILAKTMYHIYKCNYSEAQHALSEIKDGKYPQIKQLLNIDLEYEISRTNDSVNFQQTLQKYQYLLDSNPNNNLLKNLLLTRIRYIRYNYSND